MEQLTVIKVGGKIVEDAQTLNQFLSDFSDIPGHKVLVHGGGRSATQLASQLGIETKMVGGRRVTDSHMLEVVTMVYGGLVNKNIVALLQSYGIKGLGLTGADMDVIRSHRRQPVRVKSDVAGTAEDVTVDYGFVGDIDRCNGETLSKLILTGIVPVMAPLTHDGQGQMLNTNADTIASETAKALAPYFDVTLIYCFEKKGVLSNPDDEESVIRHINESEFRELLKSGVINGGMIPKIENSLSACRNGVKRVIITRADSICNGSGTVIE